MKKLGCLLAAGLVMLMLAIPAWAAPLTIDLQPDAGNRQVPTMGDHLQFWSTITNKSTRPIEGLVAWISLVEVDPGNEQPVDLEDWSAHKAIAGAALGPYQSLRTAWPMRLIKGGDYRVVVSVTDRDTRTVFTSPTIEFHVTQKPVLQTGRILPVAVGVPILIFCFIAFYKVRRRGGKSI